MEINYEDMDTDELLKIHAELFNLIINLGIKVSDLNKLLEVERELTFREELESAI